MNNGSAARRRRALGDDARPAAAKPIRLVVIAAERLYGEALCELLGRQERIQIVGDAVAGWQAVTLVQTVRPDVILLDSGVPGVHYTQIIGLLTQHAPSSRVLLLTTMRDGAEICRALRAGARGYVSKNAGLSALTRAIDGIHRGDMWVERRLIAEALWGDTQQNGNSRGEHRSNGGLTPREREILRLLASGGTNRHIAEALFISEKTVKTHLNSIFRKLNVTRRLQAVLYAVRVGLGEP